MTPLHITAGTAVSAMGRGIDAMRGSLRARRSGLRPNDFLDLRAGYIGRVDGVENHILPAALMRFECRNNRLADMALRTDGFIQAVAAARNFYGPARLAIVLGTSTSGILSGENAYAARDLESDVLPLDFDYQHTQDLFSLPRFVAAALDLQGPMLSVSNACASSSRAFVDARHLIEAGLCDAAIVGGADSLCHMTLRGFASLGLVSPGATRPCDAQRCGISIGEAAGFALLERPGARKTMPAGFSASWLGYGVSSDGHHMSTPDPVGRGAMEAMRAALSCAGLKPQDIDYINLHGTGSLANDAMEDRAVAEIFGAETSCSSTKGWSGHTLGASGILEATIAAIALENDFLPGCLNVTRPDPMFRANILTENRHTPVRHVMSNAFGFGGTNCSLIFGAAA
ncbi:beta-ketoacyl-[acyl-carrier-protein] synthase family protein [Kozakia baliensis]|uniref:Beta-ketoacyl-[acyl-carrier-protein] synthase II n=1 Tax=Kozakia baliensis TaxID=153496 RepID=A0A1D8UR75_9PROT|nr:beta-ketoacyl-[acyl-carrier-protein] synthase family protein [Kozakia baliensis]AOX16138.1 beta-ketoacyl-[acyl-carrier-protein] synthase II [Kozakia baliensis]GBR23383.1 3-oxoacyl-ACP synthase [Kozakia baliensis NRIC 0488]GEL65022.1 beta-ketoacyl-[acyl-carrier-protein] synthase II [Kozakia baliensis]